MKIEWGLKIHSGNELGYSTRSVLPKAIFGGVALPLGNVLCSFWVVSCGVAPRLIPYCLPLMGRDEIAVAFSMGA